MLFSLILPLTANCWLGFEMVLETRMQTHQGWRLCQRSEPPRRSGGLACGFTADLSIMIKGKMYPRINVILLLKNKDWISVEPHPESCPYSFALTSIIQPFCIHVKRPALLFGHLKGCIWHLWITPPPLRLSASFAICQLLKRHTQAAVTSVKNKVDPF